MLGLSVCVGRERHAPTPEPSPKRQRNPATASRPRWGLYPRAARGWGAHLAVGLCTGPRRWPWYFPAKTCVRRTRCESATRRRGLPQGCGSASGRTRSASARATRITRLARKARSLPCLSAQDRARSSLPPAIGTKATRRPGAVGRCGSPRWPWCGGVGSQRDTKELHNQQVPWAAPQHMAVARACSAASRPERCPRVGRRVCFQLGRATELPTDVQTARRAPKTTRPKPEPSARCVGKFLALQGGGREGKARGAIPIRGSGSPTQSR